MIKYKKKIISIVLALLFLTNCGGKALAEYKDGTVTSKEIEQLAELYNLKGRLNNIQLKKQLVQDYAVIKILSVEAEKESLDKSDEALYLKKLFEGNIIRNVLYQQKQDEMDKEKENIYHARHILIKVPVNPVASKDKKAKDKAKDKPADGKSEFETITQIRNDILAKKVSFEDAVTQFSQDDATKVKKGDLGYFTSGVMVGEFQNTVNRLAGESTGKFVRITVDNIKLLSKVEGAEPDAKAFEKGVIVKELEKDNPAGWTKISNGKSTVYVATNSVAPIEDESKISVPVRTIYGWHIIELLDTKKVNLNGYTKLLKKTEFKDQKNPDQLAASRAKMYWSRLKSGKLTEWQQGLYKNYGIDVDNVRDIKDDWQTSEYLISNDKLKISTQDFKNFVNWVAKDQGVKPDSILKNKENLKRYYQVFLDLQIYHIEGENGKIFDTKLYKKRNEIERKQFLAELYKRKHWFSNVLVTDKELTSEYEKMKKNKPAHMKTVKPFNEMKDDLTRQVKGQKINTLTHQNIQALLTSVQFKLNEKALK